MIIHNPPTALFIALSFIITWIAEKVQALPQYIAFDGYGYYGVLVTLIFLAILPVIKPVSREHDYQEKNQ